MYKKSLASAVLIAAMPALASASWFFSSQARNSGGNITYDIGGKSVFQNVTSGAVFTAFPSSLSGEQSVLVTPETGRRISSISMTRKGPGDAPSTTKTLTFGSAGGSLAEGPAGTFSSSATTLGFGAPDTVSFTPLDGETISLAATFAVQGLAVNATNTAGTVTPSSIGSAYYGYKLLSPVTFSFSPTPGYTITGISGVPDHSVAVTGSATDSKGVSWSVPGSASRRATVTFPVGYVFTEAVHLSSEVAQPTTPSISRITPKTVLAGKPVTLSAVASNIADVRYRWTYVSGPANVATASKDDSGKVTVSETPGPAITGLPAPYYVDNTDGVLSFTAPSSAPDLTGTNYVNAHTNLSHIGQYKFLVEAYSQLANNKPVVLATSMATVNVAPSLKDAINNQCQLCHSTIGIGSASLFSNWSSSAHYKAEVLCADCHIGADRGTHPGQGLEKYSTTYSSKNISVPAEFPDVGTSNTCVSCHAGKVSGAVVKSWPDESVLADGTIDDPGKDIAAGIVFQTLGYHFGSNNYANVNYKHDKIGTDPTKNVSGPCVTCHMVAADGKPLSNSHTGKIFTYASGTLTAFATATPYSCAACHTNTVTHTDTTLATAKQAEAGYKAALAALANEFLVQHNIIYDPAKAPYFFRPPNTPVQGWGDNRFLGAAFNLHLLSRESGAWAHNNLYAKRLIYDSIDWLQNWSGGQLTGHIDLRNYPEAAAYLGDHRP